jgi:hypothetical protein
MAINHSPEISLFAALRAEGYELPKNTVDVTIELPIDGACVLAFRVWLEQEDLAKVGRALARMGGDGDE